MPNCKSMRVERLTGKYNAFGRGGVPAKFAGCDL
jgi:hypothetical protein